MLRTVFSLSVLLATQCFALNAQAQDYPDFRSKREAVEKMQEKEIQSDLSTFTMAGVDLGVGKDPLPSIPVASYDASHISFAGNSINVNITTGKFDPSKHKLNFVEKYLVKIDNKGYYGNYGNVPKNTIATVTVTVGKDTIVIPPAAYADIYNPEFTYSHSGVVSASGGVYQSADKKKLYIYLLKREAGGSYEVTWVIQDNKYLRRVVDFGFLQ
ncbi:hypothetical protein SAMN05421788_101786 [Filimonas lacunae]|uniref:Uncharacterized protein n=1 Tax=Filimonas lacunae TaxID=477680 RepID=A0A173MPG0_9BACT|nr:hypothetical protein [Filimonas lacunae]BAV09349.1 hypothetical protein FLA_5397 [Filimonas lacunae]SIS71521.1 hypothetical protein SAMN05421788_101786 [Filimonas lacunae]